MINKIERILGESFDNLQIRDGKPFKDLLIKPSAALNEQLEVEKNNYLIKLSIDNYQQQTPDELDALVSNYIGVSRKSGRFSTGIVRVYLTQRTDIVFDQRKSVFKDVTGKRFLPRFDFSVSVDNLKFDSTINRYYIDIPIISEQPFGEEFLIKAGDLNTYLGANPFVEKVINFNDFVLTDYQESNTELYNRLKNNGTLINQTKNNYFGNLLIQNFPDIRKYLIAGFGNSLMNRDLTFNHVNASFAVEDYNFFRKKKNSLIDNRNLAFKGLLGEYTLDNLSKPNDLLVDNNLVEFDQNEYENITFKDKNTASVSSLLNQTIFSLYSGVKNFSLDGWTYSENNRDWDIGSRFVNFTRNFEKGLEIKGDYIKDEPLLAQGDSGVVLYKENSEVRNTEHMLTFIINDFKTTVTNPDNTTANITVSNNKPLYFTVLKKGIKDLPSNFKSSTIDGLGVVVMKQFPDNRPNVFIVDGSSAVGNIAFEEQILQLGSERVLAGKSIPLVAGEKYSCIMQINDNYGMTITFRNQFNSEIGKINVGSGANNSEYSTTYKSVERIEEYQKGGLDLSPTRTVARKIIFIKSTETLDEQCSGFLNLDYTVAISNSSTLVKNYGDSKRLLYIDSTNPQSIFRDFGKALIGDFIEINGIRYTIVNKFDHHKIEIDRDITTLRTSGVDWKIWRPLTINSDFSIPRKAVFKNIILLNKGIDSIKQNTGSGNLANVLLNFNYIKQNGSIVQNRLIEWNPSADYTATDMTVYPAPTTAPYSVNLKEVAIFNEALTNNEDYFVGSKNFNSVALTQVGFNKCKGKYFRASLTQGATSKSYVINKNLFKQGYILPVGITNADISKIKFINKVSLDSSSFSFLKNTHYSVENNDSVCDILIPTNYISLFSGNVNIECEVVGINSYAQIITEGSSLSSDKLYLTTGSISDTNYFSVIVNNERYLIKSINLNSSNSPFSDKKIEVVLDKALSLINNNSVELRKKTTITVNSSLMKFGYRYDLIQPNSLNYWDATSAIMDMHYGSQDLVMGEDFDYDRETPIVNYYIASNIINISNFASNEYIGFITDYREIVEEIKNGKFIKFEPISNGSYLGIGFKSVSNADWNLIELRSRKLSENYSAMLINTYINDNVISNEDRLFIDLTTYATNVNSTTPISGSRLLIYNHFLSKWELLVENSAASSEDGNFYLQYYNGSDIDRKYDFGYWYGSEFISINKEFYPTNYLNSDGYLNMLLVTRGKNQKDFSGNILFGEAKLFLDNFNIRWQRGYGVHLGNKVDYWIASNSTSVSTILNLNINSVISSLTLDSNFKKPLKKINSITTDTGLPIGFELVNLNKDLRFSTDEQLQINFSNPLTPGTYNINYEYFPHVAVKQEYVNSLESHIDVLVKQYVPTDVTINLNYFGNMDLTNAKKSILNYIRFSSFISLDEISNIMETFGAVLITFVDNVAPIQIEEYDILSSPIKRDIYSNYSLKKEKYFEITLDNINLIKN